MVPEGEQTGVASGAGWADVSKRRVRSAERVAAILDLLGGSPVSMRHSEVASALGLPKSSTSNLLDTLVDTGLLRRDVDGYALGAKLIELGAAAAARMDVRQVARPALLELSELGIGTANLAILQGHGVLYIEKVNNPDHVIQIATRAGGTAPAHATALGKVLVAALPVAERERWLSEHVFEPVTEHTIVSRSGFELALASAAADGYAVDNQEQSLRVVCTAAPVTDHTGTAIAAISLTCLSADRAADVRARISAVKRSAAQVSSLLGAPETSQNGERGIRTPE